MDEDKEKIPAMGAEVKEGIANSDCKHSIAF